MRTRLADLLAESAARQACAPALTFGDTTLTYGELWREAGAVATGLRRRGLRRGERVAVYLDKRLEAVAAMFGASASGGVFVPINPLLRPKQVGHILTDCGVRVLVTTPERLAMLSPELDECKTVEHIVLVGQAGTAGAEEGQHRAITAWADLRTDADRAAFAAGHIEHSTIDVDMAAILYTSGSTGKPKGVVLSHRNMLVGAESVSSYLGNTADDVILAALPLSFDAGLSQVTTAFSAGAHVVLMNYLLAGDVVRLCAAHGVTGLTCVPPLWIQLAEQQWPAEATQHLRYFANTGGRMPKPTLDKLRAIFPGAQPFLMYGLTEAFRSTYLDPSQIDNRPASIGKAIPNAEILVVRPDGTTCDAGESGELVHRGALVAMGYWNDPERTAERFRPAPGREGELLPEIAVWSGDIVTRDEEGYLFFVGRNDEMIKTSGYRVSPAEIEEVAYGTGLVRDAVALGIDDAKLGHHIALVASAPRGDELDQTALLRELKRQLPTYMVPRTIVVRTEIPRSPNGKFDRNLLRQELAQ